MSSAATTMAPKIKTISVRPETHRLLKRIATRRRQSMTTVVDECAKAMDKAESKAPQVP